MAQIRPPSDFRIRGFSNQMSALARVGNWRAVCQFLFAKGFYYTLRKDIHMRLLDRRLTLLLACSLAGAVIPSQAIAGTSDSTAINKLLADTRTEASELVRDSSDLDSFTRSKLSWESYANEVQMIRGHVNNAGKLLTQLNDAKSEGSSWQQTAIDRIQPLLKELAANTQATIEHLNANKSKVHMQPFVDYVKANYDLSSELESLVRDLVAYGDAKAKVETLSAKLELN